MNQPFHKHGTIQLAFVTLLLACWTMVPRSIHAAPYSAEDIPYHAISDDAGLRRKLVEPWFTLPVSQLLKQNAKLYTLETGESVEVRIERGTTDVIIVLARERQNLFPGWVQGSWVFYRNIGDGQLKKIRLYLRSDPYVYVEFRPFDSNKSVYDVVAYSGYVAYSRPVPLSIQDFYSISMNKIFDVLSKDFPGYYFDVDPRMYRDLRTLVSQVRSYLPQLAYADDGALDETGKPVYIATLQPQGPSWGLNCSGFTKWLIDGLLRPVTGAGLPVSVLKQPAGNRGSNFTEPVETKLDPFFGLDWTRNLALQANRVLRSPQYATLEEIEVTDSPISWLSLKKNGKTEFVSYPPYLKNAGFNIEGLPSLMYSLAVRYPQWFYLVSVNTDRADRLRQYPSGTVLPEGGGTGLRRHFHVAALVPCFTEDGVFKVTVFESAAETSFDAFVKRYPGYQVHLVRVPFHEEFTPLMPNP
ncbi:hypothetical protein [Gracilinema caldarium]|uniref:hypothetical protein n=1 Tax=Gracilinema caldarium TaxID=215591 RepID=UPI0026EE38CD|nr:hypothetical protein [Gracilinema caldarium]